MKLMAVGTYIKCAADNFDWIHQVVSQRCFRINSAMFCSWCAAAYCPPHFDRRRKLNFNYRQVSNISANLKFFLYPRAIVFLLNPLKPGVKLRMKMQLEQRRQAMLQLHLSYQQFYCLLRYSLYYWFYGRCGFASLIGSCHLFSSTKCAIKSMC